MAELTLSQIYIYPVKSLRGIAVPRTRLTARGAEWDRRWMLVDADGKFLTQRSLGSMVFLQPRMAEEHLLISDLRGGRAELAVPLQTPPGARVEKVTVWQDECEAVFVSSAADRWFSAALGRDCHLVYMPEGSRRPVDPEYAEAEEVVSFADGFPYLIIGEASLRELNHRLPEPVEMVRFRPNLVFSGGTPFVEDEWKHFTIGSARFRGTKACARCQIPTIDLRTGKTSKEPTRTLATFRRAGNKILFGMNVCWELDNEKSGSSIEVGDPITVK